MPSTEYSPEYIPNLSSADIIKLQAATFLSLCTALDGAGIVSSTDMATILSTHIGETDQDACSQVIRAILVVLQRERADIGNQESDEGFTQKPFTVIQGDRTTV